MLADSVGLALLVVLDTLGPAERLAFVLHDMFELPFEEIAAASLMIRGAAAVARQAQSGLAAALRVAHLRPAVVNGAAGVVATVRGRPITVVGFTVADGKIADPERVRKIAAAVLTDE